MPSFTPYFGLAFFNVGDDLSDISNVTDEMDRFVIIDRQLYGLYSIFGSGVINGWDVSAPETQDPNNITVEIDAGIGIVNLMAAETTFTSEVTGLPPNQVIYIFAQVTGMTAVNRQVQFFFSQSNFASQAILLASVVTGDNGIVSIDSTVRREIGFQSIIDEEIKLHKHRGSPTKIDLQLETKGQLPGNKIGNLSADLVTEGKFTIDRLPPIDHASLTDIGLFTHDEIDAMLRKVVDNTDEQRLIEISLSNHLRQIIFLKYKFTDVDENFLNELAFIPGISPDSWIDWDNSDANISTETGCISGREVEGGQAMSVLWNSATSFNAGASLIEDVAIGTNGVQLIRADLESQLVEGFEEAVDGSILSSFTATVEAVNSTTGVYADASVKTEMDKSGRFNVNQTNRGIFTKTFDPVQDWSEWDRLTLSVKCSSVTHGTVSLYLQDINGVTSSSFQILAANEVTSNIDPDLDGFETRTMVISTFANRSQVQSLVIVVEDVFNDYSFWIDDISLTKSQTYVAQGTLRLRYEAGEEVAFNSLVYDTVLPSGTNVKARLRVADVESDLDNALFTAFVSSADVFSQTGKWAEVEVQLFADSAQSVSPTVSSVELSLIANSEDSGFVVETAAQWAAGESSNITFIESGTTAQIREPVTVGDYVYLNLGNVNEVNENHEPVFGISGEALPVSEVQAYNLLFNAQASFGLTNPRSVVRTNDRRYIVCDTDNHRIIIFDQTGSMISVYAGANEDVAATSSENVVGLTATYNTDTGVLWLGFSKAITLDADSFEQIVITVGTSQINLSEEGQTIAAAQPVSGRVIPVLLTADHQSVLAATQDTVVLSYGAQVSPDYNLLFTNQAITVRFAPIIYYEFIFNPVYAAESLRGNLWICNATQLPLVNDSIGNLVAPSVPDTRQLQEFDPNVDLNNFTNSVFFTKEFGGQIIEDANGNIYVAGTDSQRNGRVFANPMNGSPVIVFQSPVSNFPSAIDMDTDGFLWVGESSSVARGGRILQMDTKGNLFAAMGDVYTQINSVQALVDGNLLIGT